MLSGGLYKGTRKVDLNAAAEREARQRESTEAANSDLGLHIKVMLIGMSGGSLARCLAANCSAT